WTGSTTISGATHCRTSPTRKCRRRKRLREVLPPCGGRRTCMGGGSPRGRGVANRTATVTRVARAAAKAELAALSDRALLARFVAERDQAAFAAVVARHSGMVLGVCRRVLGNTSDPEDACQAVFLLLAEKAGTTRWQASVANWLYSTARNVARNARVAA